MPPIQAFDITHWERDFDYPVFPQGARAKRAVFSPADALVYPLTAGRRQLFKYSLPRYPTEFWSEIVAYHIGAHLGIEVPLAYPAFDTGAGHAGALIEWFYEDDVERFFPAGDLFQQEIPGFDRRRGTQHNFVTMMDIRDRLSQFSAVDRNWYVKWAEMLFLDALTGNGDRHQDNWGIIVSRVEGQDLRRISMAPAFDNGSSLGREYPDERLPQLDAAWVATYVARGRHHIKWLLDDKKGQPHVEMLLHLARVFPAIRARMRILALSSIEPIIQSIRVFTTVAFPLPLTVARADFMERLLRARLERLRLALT